MNKVFKLGYQHMSRRGQNSCYRYELRNSRTVCENTDHEVADCAQRSQSSSLQMSIQKICCCYTRLYK
ncbi:unnamed protein product [Amoebophrya sp. A25]|nr:unnamed protein product [Amoebophrya sp. A25]|eukprot:GSA25T00001591001.1